MELLELRHMFEHDIRPATFHADGCSALLADGPRALVYPIKGGKGFLWLLMVGDITKVGSRVIQSGGVERRFQVAVASAVHALLERIDK